MKPRDVFFADVDAFLAPDEFGQEILFNGETVVAVIEEGHGSRSSQSMGGLTDVASLGLAENVRTLYLADTLPERPVPEQVVDIDGEPWVVEPEASSVRVEMGMLCIRLSRVYA